MRTRGKESQLGYGADGKLKCGPALRPVAGVLLLAFLTTGIGGAIAVSPFGQHEDDGWTNGMIKGWYEGACIPFIALVTDLDGSVASFEDDYYQSRTTGGGPGVIDNEDLCYISESLALTTTLQNGY